MTTVDRACSSSAASTPTTAYTSPACPRRVKRCWHPRPSVTAGGKGANQAVAAARAGAPTTIVGAIGDDPDGRLLARALAEQDIDARHVRVIPDARDGTRAHHCRPPRREHHRRRRRERTKSSPSPTSTRVFATSRPATCCFFNSKHHSRWSGTPPAWHRAQAPPSSSTHPVPDSAHDLFDDVDLLVVNEHELARPRRRHHVARQHG